MPRCTIPDSQTRQRPEMSEEDLEESEDLEDAEDVKDRANHPRKVRSTIQYRSDPNVANPNTNPSSSARLGRAPRRSHRNGISATKASGPIPTGGWENESPTPLATATRSEAGRDRRTRSVRRSPGRAAWPGP